MTVRATIFISKDVKDNDKAKDFYRQVLFLLNRCNVEARTLDPPMEPFKTSMQITETVPYLKDKS